jgi:hypothetical protein
MLVSERLSEYRVGPQDISEEPEFKYTHFYTVDEFMMFKNDFCCYHLYATDFV